MKRILPSLSLVAALFASLPAPAASLKFDGNNDYLIVNPFSAVSSPELTVEFWMRGDVPVKSFTTVLSYAVPGSGGDNHFFVDIRDSRQTIGVRVAGSAGFLAIPADTADPTWHHVALSWRSSDGQFDFYLDGVQLLSTNGMWQGLTPTANGSFVVAQDQDSVGGSFDPNQAYGGKLDEIRFWSVYRTQEEIQSRMHQRLTGDEAGLEAYYPLEEGGNNLFIDHSGNGWRAIGSGVIWDRADDGTTTPIPFLPTVASVSSTGAVVHVSVNPSDGPATNHFEWGRGSDAMQFDSTDEVFMEQAPDLANRSFSFEFWARRPASATVMYPFSLGTSGTRTLLHVGWANGDDIKFGFFADDLVVRADIDDSDWHHWAFTFDTNTLTRRIYLDGIQVGQGTAGGKFVGTGPLRLGRYIANNADLTFEGTLDEVRIWQDVVLDPATIREWKDKELDGTHPDFASLAGYWPFSEGRGRKVIDASGNGFDGVYVQNPVRVKGARSVFTESTTPVVLSGTNQALSLDGKDDYVDVPDGVWFNGSDNFTIEARVFVRNYADYSRLIDFGNGANQANVILALTSSTTGNPYLAVIRGGANQNLISPVAIPLNEWAHVAVTWESGTARLYLNGVQVASGPVHAPDNVNRTSNYIAKSHYAGNLNADALFDFVRIWNLARTPEELAQFQSANVSPDATGLMLNYQFDEGSGGIAVDSRSASPQDGVLVNSPTWQPVVADAATLANLIPGTTYHVRSVSVNTNGTVMGSPIQLAAPAPERGTALVFDGVNDYVRLSDLDADAPLTEVTVEVWQRVHALKNQSVFSLEPDLTGNRLQAHTPWSNGTVYWDFGNISGNGRLTYNPPVSLLGEWNHFAFVSSQMGGYMRIYRNGVLEAQKSSMDPREMGSFDLILGRYTLSGTSYYLDGEMDEVRIWNQARTGDEIRQNMNVRLADATPGLVAHLRMDEGGGTLVNDSAGILQIHQGLLAGRPQWVSSDAPVGLPIAVTLAATDVELGSATVRGTVNGQNTLPSDYWFEYGPDEDYGFTSAVNSLPVGVDEVSVEVTLNDLLGNTEYHYRLVAANANGTNYGGDRTFTMLHPGAETALSMDGVNDRVQLAGFSGFPSTNITVEFWMRTDDTTKAGTPISYAVPGRYNEVLVIDYRNFTIGLGTDSTLSTGVSANDGLWHHIAFRWRNSDGLIEIFKDGTAVYTNHIAVGHALASGGYFIIGQEQDSLGGSFSTAQAFLGEIDEVRVWRSFRTDSDIADNYTRRLRGNEPGLALYYRFDEGTGTMALDSSGNGQNGTIYNGPVYVSSGAGLFQPLVETLPATPVLATTATLRGTVNPGGSNTVAYFEYGTTIAYGNQTDFQVMGGSIATLPISAGLTNLEPGTTYHFRTVAFNDFGTVEGEDETFTTLVLGCGWPIATKLTGGQADSPKHVVDAEGNVYVAGLFSGSATFKTTLVPDGSGTNAFIGKVARGADWLWATNVPISADGHLLIQSIAIDSSKNVCVAGEFTGVATFGTNVLSATNGTPDLFVAKLNTTGDQWLWAQSAGNTFSNSVSGVAAGPSGAVFVAGHYQGSVDFGTNTLSSSGASRDAFVAKLDANGNWLWARSAGGTGGKDHAASIVVNASEDVFVTGAFEGTGIFGTFNLTSKGDTDVFIARLNTDGTWLLARRAGGAGADTGTALAVDPAGQIYLLGRFNGAADYNNTIQNLNLGGGVRSFVAKLNINANMLWYAQAGTGTADSLAVDSFGRAYIAGDFTVSTQFGEPPGLTLVSSGNSDVFLAQLDTEDGTWNWSEKIGSSGSEYSGGIAVDAQGGIVLSGSFQNTVQIGFVLLTTANDRDIFVARLTPDKVFEHNTFVIGEAIPVPVEAQDPGRSDGAAVGLPDISLLEKAQPDSDELNSFVWSLSEKKLYPVREVTAVLKWPLTEEVTNTTSVATCVGRTVWPSNPRIHVANAPANLEPNVPGFPLRYLTLSFTTINGANVDPGEKLFTAPEPGWSVIQFLDTGGAAPNPNIHPSRFEVVRTVLWNDPEYLIDNAPAAIGSALTHVTHADPEGRNGYVYFAKAFYDGTGAERAYTRSERIGPIIPVNKDTPALDDDLVVVWYLTGPNGIAWPSTPVRYLASWPTDADQLVISSRAGSGMLSLLDYPSKRVYNQPDPTLPGYNPNEEHAALYGDTLFALRNDLNNVINLKASDPYVLLKYLSPGSGDWAMKVYQVVLTNAAFPLSYSGEAGSALPLPEPLTFLNLCGTSNRVVSGPGYQDYAGRLYARGAGVGLSGTNIVVRYWYPLQPGFFYDLNLDGVSDLPVGTCIPWLDRRPGGVAGTPVNVNYDVTWPTSIPTLQIGETLLNSKLDGANLSLPDVRNFADAQVIFDQGNPQDTNGPASLVRLYDPLSERTLQLAANFSLPVEVITANDAGRLVFSDLPYAIRARLKYDDLNKRLSFGGVLDESVDFGGPQNPLLLINVLSPREKDRIKQLSSDPDFLQAIDDLYDLTRNPNRLDADGDGQPDDALLIGLDYEFKTNQTSGVIATNIVPEKLGDLPKALTAGPGTGSGFVTVIENDNPLLGGLPVNLHVIRIEGGPFRGDIKVLYPDNVFDEKLTLRHSADFGGEPQNFEFEWYYQPDQPGFSRTNLPVVDANGIITDDRGWLTFPGVPAGVNGYNDITIGDGGEASLLTLADNWFICRYRGYTIGGQTNVWSDWVGAIGGGEAQLAEGWVKRVVFGLNPFEARSDEFHENETVTFASMLQQAGTRYEGDIAFNPAGGNINSIGLIEAYETVLRRARKLSIDADPGINFAPANNALLLAAGRIADLYMLLGNEAFADAADPTIGFRTGSAEYGSLAPSIFAFQNQLDSLLEEELALLRGRDDSSATVRSAPVYNRLFWNFTHDEGEVAYAQAYNITDQDGDGFITANDAQILYPQGHGDAWGHYLTAVKTYYGLLRNTNYDWIPRTESILLAGVPVQVDYLDERKFARAAAAKAKAGAEIVDLSYRLNYVDDPDGQWQGYKDTNPNRAWGLSEWGHRAGSGAFFDWVTANAILPATDTNANHTGLTKIDRTTVEEIREIEAAYQTVQEQVDKADRGLNPLGLVKNVVPFDIDPSQIDAGKTHFEQIYDRALEAVQNTLTVFDHANQLSQALRRLQDSVNDFSQNVDDQERDYKNRLIEIFGYPYAGDIGAGKTYPSGYDGPDLYHYMYIDAVELNGETAPPAEAFTAFFSPLSTAETNIKHYFPDDLSGLEGALEQDTLAVDYPRVAADYAFVPPASWGERQAPGEIQIALSSLLLKEAALKRALENYDALIARINDAIDLLEARYGLEAQQLRVNNVRTGVDIGTSVAITAGTAAERYGRKSAFIARRMGDIAAEALPKVVGLANDPTSAARAAILSAQELAAKPFEAVELIGAAVKEVANATKEITYAVTEEQLRVATLDFELQQRVKELEQLIREEAPLRLEIFESREAVNQSAGEYLATVSRGLRLTQERIAFRKNAAAETQASRYQDMTFRIFRNDAIQKYRAQFDLAARYVFLAAVAYDFETQLLGGHAGAGRDFLTDIIRQRALGQVENGVPVAGRHGLADPLARLSQNFNVLKGQLGFNNPQTETGQFSLRNEFFRMRDSSHESWQAELRKHIVPDLWQVPEFRRYCRPFAPESAGPQPGLVIRFPTTVTFGLNYFGWPLGGGDSSYDSTFFATKVRSAGVWFSDYDGSGLSATPRVYLVPAGADILRSPSGNNLETREWRVVDQKIPVPFPIGFSSLNDPTWIPMNDSLSDTFAEIRRFSRFRAYHDSGVFDPAETVSDSRLIGRSVWNTDWMLIIPGGTFLFDPDEGLETFIDSVTDIKIFYQTYAYSGN